MLELVIGILAQYFSWHSNVGIQGDLWQAKPDTGSALE